MREPLVNDVPAPAVRLAAVDVGKTVRVSRRHRRQILEGVDFSFEPGSLTAVMGPSGAGKTTLLDVLRTGACSSGAITINGAPLSRRTARQLIKTIPQDDVLLPGLTALEMLSFAAQLSLPRNATRAERAERVGSVMRELHLSEEDGRTKIGSVDDRGLSGGQRKRVSIGIELLAQPAVLLVDE